MLLICPLDSGVSIDDRDSNAIRSQVTVVAPDTPSDHYVMDANATSFGDAGPDADTEDL